MSRVLKTKTNQVTQKYGKTPYDNNHLGVDVVGHYNALDYIIAHSDGVVTIVQDGYDNNTRSSGMATYGNMIELEHENGYKTRYAHLQKGLSLKKGDKVKKGQVIGYMGNTGNSYGAHLHFEVWNKNGRIDPEPYLDKDLPTASKIDVTYQAYDNVLKKFLSEIRNYNTVNTNGYAGWLGHSLGGLRVKASKGTITVQSHVRGGSWLSPITKWDNTDYGYSGLYGKDIDMIMIKSSEGTARYRAHIKNGNWLDWITKFDINDSVNGMAGIYGKAIDLIQIEII